MIIFLLIQVSYQQCSVNKEALHNFYKQNDEIIRLNLFDYFYGYNLEFQAENFEVQNVINQLNTQTTFGNIIDSQILSDQFSKQWLNLLITLSYQNEAFIVEIFTIYQNELNLLYSSYIPQSTQQLTCYQIAFIDPIQFVVSCSYTTNTIQTQFYIGSIESKYFWEIYNYETQSSQPVSQDIQVAINNQSEVLIFRGSYDYNLTGIVEVYNLALLKNNSDSVYYTFNNEIIRQFKIRDFEIYLMNLTTSINVYSINNFSQTRQFNFESYFPTAQLLAFEIEEQNSNIVVYTDIIGDNLFDFNQTTLLKRSYVRISFNQNSSVSLYLNDEFIGIQINNQYYLYNRFTPNFIINANQQTIVGLNQLPYNILTYDNEKIFYSQIVKPSIFINSTNDILINITATSIELNVQIVCWTELNVSVNSELLTIKQYNKDLPDQVIIKNENIYFKPQDYASGPLLQISGQSSLNSMIIYNPSIQNIASYYQWQQIEEVFSFYSHDFNIYIQFVLQYEYVKNVLKSSKIISKLCTISLNDLIQQDTLECTSEKQVYQLNAPITKLQFTDYTDPEEIYFVANIADAAVVIYQLTAINPNEYITKFICEPIPIDESATWLSIQEFYVIGNYLYYLLGRVQQIWIYNIQSCIKVFEITNQMFGDEAFYPQQITGKVVYDQDNKMRQIIFINCITKVLVFEIINDVPVYQNEINVNNTIKSVSVIKDTIILVLDKRYNSLMQYYYSINQPSNEIIFIKYLPQFGVTINKNLIISSDDQFFYILMSNNLYYVYDPTLTAQDCLLYQLNYYGDYIASTYIPNTFDQSVLSIASKTNLYNFILANPQILIAQMESNANSDQKLYLEFDISFQSTITTNQLILSGLILAYDTLFSGELDQNIIFEQNNISTQIPATQTVQLQLQLQQGISNNIIGYSLNNLFTDGQFPKSQLIQPFHYISSLIGEPKNISQIAFTPSLNQMYLQNIYSIFQYNDSIFTTLFTFDEVQFLCLDLYYDSIGNQLLSLCQQSINYNIVILNLQNLSNTTFQMQNVLYLPLKAQIISNLISILAIQQGDRDYSILLSNSSNFPLFTSKIVCQNEITSNGVGDYFITQITQNDVSYLFVMFTCPFSQVIQYATISTENFTILNQTTFQMTEILPKAAIFLEIILVQIDSTSLTFILTTKQFYSLIIQTTYSFNSYVILSNDNNKISQIAPMQFANMEKNVQYYNKYLFAVFHDSEQEYYQLSIYDLNNTDQNIYYSLDSLIFNSPIQYTIINSNNTLFVKDHNTPIFQFNYSNYVLIELENMTYDYTIMLLQIQQKFGDILTLPLQFYYQQPGKTKNWVKSTLIGIGSIYVLILFGIIIFKYAEKKKSESRNNLEELSVELNYQR